MFPTPKRFTKLIAICLAVLLLLGNPAVVVPASAATDSASSTQTNELPVLAIEKPAVNETPLTQAVFNSDSNRLSNDQKAEQFLNQLIPYYLQNGKRQGPEWLRTTDINFSFTENYKPVFSLETIQPFSQTTKKSELLFWQGRYSYQNDANTTANLGIGWRKLSEDKTNIIGFNAFYDYGFKHDLSRVGVGAEYFNKLAEYRANFYFPTSGDRQIGETTSTDGILYSYIRAVQGFDYEVGSTLANAPWLGFYASGFYYDNKHNDDEKGYKLRSTVQLSPRISMEMGYTKSNLSSGDLYGKIQYQLADKLGPSLLGDSPKDKKLNDISYKLLQKVQRENQIKTETFTKFVSYVGSISTTVINGSGQPIQGASLQAYHQNENPVGSAVITNAAGTGVISGLDVGKPYKIKATYFSYSDSSTVTVQKDQVVSTTIPLPVVGGTIVVNVFDAQGGSVSGATVTANVVNGGIARAEGNLFDRILGVKTAFAAEAAFTLSLTTGSDGTAHFANLPPGNYRFTVQSNGQNMNSIAANVPTNGGTSNVNVVLPSSNNTTGSAAITVTDGSSLLSGATASVTVNGTTQTVNTNSAGLATFSDLPAGSYTFSVSKDGYISNTVTVAVNNGVTAAGTIALALPTGNATITVNDGTNPISGATISVTVNGVVQTATTNASGQATFTNVPVGTYTFTVTKSGYNTTTCNATIVNSGLATATVSLIRQTGNATITVNDRTNPISGATVSVTVNGTAQTATTNASGQATFTNVPTDTYTFTVTKTGYNTTTCNATIVNSVLATAAVSLIRQTGNATLTVNDGTNPISGATISVMVDGAVQTVTTNASGQATFTNVPTDTYTFTVTKTGYNTTTCSGTIVNSVLATATVSLIRQTGNATLTVNDGTNPISGATISVMVDGAVQTVTTNASGQATFTNVPTDTYTFTVTKSGYNTTTCSATIVNSGLVTATVSLIRQTGNATITVNDGTNPISGATVSVTVNGTAQTATTNASGQATFTNVPTDTYTFTVTKSGYNTTTCNATIVNSGLATATVSLIRQTGNATITVNDGTNPISGTTVSVTVNGTAQTATTNASGQATFTNVPIGTYTFTATKSGYDSSTTSVMVTNGTTVSGTIALTRQFGTITITITDGATTVSGATVTLNETTSGTTDAMGQVIFQSQPVGVTGYTVTKSGYDTKSGSITIVNGTSSETIAITRQTGTATITITDGTNPISDAAVTIPAFARTVTTNELGQATFTDVPTGIYNFTATKTGYRSNNTTVLVSHGTTTNGTIFIVRQTGSATIMVTEGMAPIQGATVSVTVDGTEQTIVTDLLGRAQFNNLPIGSYSFTVTKTDYNTNTCSATVVNLGNTPAVVSLTRQTGNAAITVNDGTNPISGASVSITVNGTVQTMTTNGLGQATFTSIPTGTYTFTATKSGYDSSTTNVSVMNGSTATGSISMSELLVGTVEIQVFSLIMPRPLSNYTVFVDVNGTTRSATTDANAIATFTNLPVGTYRFYNFGNWDSMNITVLKGQTVRSILNVLAG